MYRKKKKRKKYIGYRKNHIIYSILTKNIMFIIVVVQGLENECNRIGKIDGNDTKAFQLTTDALYVIEHIKITTYDINIVTYLDIFLVDTFWFQHFL